MGDILLKNSIRPEVLEVEASGIVEVAVYARTKENVIPLWVGQGNQSTPEFISKPTMESLAKGETFYGGDAGLFEAREALAAYYKKQFGANWSPASFFITGSGMHAIDLALRATAGAGDEVIYLSPAWPNFVGCSSLAGIHPKAVELEFGDNGWSLDVEKIKDAITPKTKALFINSPSNPTGWTADIETLIAIRDIARENGIWIIADEIYSRFYYGGKRAPSFIDVTEADDRIIYVNSFSKNWAMTGWRLGWIAVNPALGPIIENLIQYSNSGAQTFLQRGAVAALNEGDAFVQSYVDLAAKNRDILCTKLLATGKVKLVPPQGAFYLFFGIDNITDTRQAALKMVDDIAVGLAPGSAFGKGGEHFFRLCFLRDQSVIEEAADRLAGWISRQ